MTGKKQEIVCNACGAKISGINKAKNEGWILNEDGTNFCCCVCVQAYRDKQRNKKK